MNLSNWSSMDAELAEVARRSYRAYVDKDRAAMEQIIAEDFRFTSPLDNRLDRKTYFERCWPNCQSIAEFEFVGVVPDNDRVYVCAVTRRRFPVGASPTRPDRSSRKQPEQSWR
jgi:ketosteroid isomerase-like protein